MATKQEILVLKDKGYTYKEIAKIIGGISRARVHQIATDFKRGSRMDYPAIITKEILNKIPDIGLSEIKGVSYKLFKGRNYLREKVRKRDNYTCLICGRKWQEGKRRFEVHHLELDKEGREGEKYDNNKDIKKMITLCNSCHRRLPHNQIKSLKKLSTLDKGVGYGI